MKVYPGGVGSVYGSGHISVLRFRGLTPAGRRDAGAPSPRLRQVFKTYLYGVVGSDPVALSGTIVC